MSFELIAKNLLKEQASLDTAVKAGRSDVLVKLERAGFGRDDLFNELRALYDNAEDDATKRQILDMVLKIYGDYVNKETERAAPVFQINIKGDNDAIVKMLCPPQEAAA